jgi:purine-cytosine permease-like protein
MDKLFLPLMILGLISPLAAIVAAVNFFVRHRERVEPERRVPVIGYVLAIISCAAIGGYFGLVFGIGQACPQLGNLCGLWGVFVTGPISFAVGILLVGVMVSLIRPATRPDESSST